MGCTRMACARGICNRIDFQLLFPGCLLERFCALTCADMIRNCYCEKALRACCVPRLGQISLSRNQRKSSEPPRANCGMEELDATMRRIRGMGPPLWVD